MCGKLFDEKVKKIYTELKIPVNSSSQSMPAPSRHAVNDFKRKLKEQLTSSYQFLEITKQESSGNSSNKDSYFFGGRWSAFATLNTERRNHFLPNDSFCSSHLAIGAKFSANGSYLSSQWR